MSKKKGVSITVLAITIIIITILAGVVTSSIYSTINFSKITTWANELTYIQDTLNEKLKNSSAVPLSQGSTSIDLSGLSNDDISEQFEGEIIVDNSVELEIIDLGLLNITDTVYGNKNTEDDVYAYSETTNRVYYVTGIKINGKMYYTATNRLLDTYEIERRTNNNITTVVFEPSKIGYTNEAVTVTVKVPVSFTDVTVTTSQNSVLVGSATLNGNINEYTVNTSEVTGNYIITVTYTKAGEEYTSTYEVNGYDNTAPVISVELQNGNIYTVTATDNNKVLELKYIEGKIKSEDIEEYFQNNGKEIVNKRLLTKDSVKDYTIYAKDYAGNYSYKQIMQVYFDVNGGSMDTTSKYLYSDSQYGELPVPTKEGYSFLGWSYSGIPDDYQQIEYIQSTGVQYINSDFVLNQNSSVKLDFQMTSTDSKIMFGARRSTDSCTYTINIGTISNLQQFVSGYYGGNEPTRVPPDTKRHIIYRDKNKLYFDGVLKYTTSSYNNFTTPNTAYIFGCNQSGSLYLPTSYKLYSLTIMDNGVLARNFIPCYRKNDSVIGLFDTVNNVFYTNSGTGTFIKGDYIYVTNTTMVKEPYAHTLTAIWN